MCKHYILYGAVVLLNGGYKPLWNVHTARSIFPYKSHSHSHTHTTGEKWNSFIWPLSCTNVNAIHFFFVWKGENRFFALIWRFLFLFDYFKWQLFMENWPWTNKLISVRNIYTYIYVTNINKMRVRTLKLVKKSNELKCLKFQWLTQSNESQYTNANVRQTYGRIDDKSKDNNDRRRRKKWGTTSTLYKLDVSVSISTIFTMTIWPSVCSFVQTVTWIRWAATSSSCICTIWHSGCRSFSSFVVRPYFFCVSSVVVRLFCRLFNPFVSFARSCSFFRFSNLYCTFSVYLNFCSQSTWFSVILSL